jgi:hypothetical protein
MLGGDFSLHSKQFIIPGTTIKLLAPCRPAYNLLLRNTQSAAPKRPRFFLCNIYITFTYF